jgi:hypothetical protein
MNRILFSIILLLALVSLTGQSVLAGQGDHEIIALPLDSPAKMPSLAVSQSNITGRVVDLDGEPVAGVSISTSGAKTTTDSEGQFQLAAEQTAQWVTFEHPGSVSQARRRADEAGLGGRVRFETASAQSFDGGPYDLVTTFDALHDMGDPLGAARHIRRHLADDGTWMIVEPAAGPTVSDNMNPVGRLYYSFSTFLCVPNALSQEGGYSLGAQAGEEPIRRLAVDAGFSRFRRAAETPFNLVYEARP